MVGCGDHPAGSRVGCGKLGFQEPLSRKLPVLEEGGKRGGAQMETEGVGEDTGSLLWGGDSVHAGGRQAKSPYCRSK